MTDLLNFPDYNRPQLTINIIEKIAGTKQYHQFGICLLDDKDGSQMSVLEQNYPKNIERIVMETLRRWMQGKSGKAPITWKTLIQCFRDTKLNVLADDIENFFIQPNHDSSASLSKLYIYDIYTLSGCKMLCCSVQGFIYRGGRGEASPQIYQLPPPNH